MTGRRLSAQREGKRATFRLIRTPASRPQPNPCLSGLSLCVLDQKSEGTPGVETFSRPSLPRVAIPTCGWEEGPGVKREGLRYVDPGSQLCRSEVCVGWEWQRKARGGAQAPGGSAVVAEVPPTDSASRPPQRGAGREAWPGCGAELGWDWLEAAPPALGSSRRPRGRSYDNFLLIKAIRFPGYRRDTLRARLHRSTTAASTHRGGSIYAPGAADVLPVIRTARPSRGGGGGRRLATVTPVLDLPLGGWGEPGFNWRLFWGTPDAMLWKITDNVKYEEDCEVSWGAGAQPRPARVQSGKLGPVTEVGDECVGALVSWPDGVPVLRTLLSPLFPGPLPVLGLSLNIRPLEKAW